MKLKQCPLFSLSCMSVCLETGYRVHLLIQEPKYIATMSCKHQYTFIIFRAAKMCHFLSFNTTLIINIYHSIINITDSFCLVQGIFQPSIPLTHTDAKHNYVSIIHINHIFHQCYLTNKTSVPQEKQLSPLRKKQRVENLERKKKTSLVPIYGL